MHKYLKLEEKNTWIFAKVPENMEKVSERTQKKHGGTQKNLKVRKIT